jgi:hypothetical protein
MAQSSGRSVGGSIRSMCTKCKTATRHIIVSVVGGEAAKVQCTTCDGIHNYRDPGVAGSRPPSESSGKGRPAKRVPPIVTIEEEWLAQMKGRDPKQAVPYGQGKTVHTGDLIEHPSFGFGLVRKVIPANKIEVHFRDGIRLLRWEA